MSKERLEEIKERVLKNKAHYKLIGTNESYWGYSYELSDEDYKWLIEQVEKYHNLDFVIEDLGHQRDELMEQNKRYREAIEFGIEYLKNSDIRHVQLVVTALKSSLEGEE